MWNATKQTTHAMRNRVAIANHIVETSFQSAPERALLSSRMAQREEGLLAMAEQTARKGTTETEARFLFASSRHD